MTEPDQSSNTTPVEKKSAPVPSWGRVVLPSFLVPASWIVLGVTPPPGVSSETAFLYLLFMLLSGFMLVARLLGSLFRLRWNRLILRSLLTIVWVFLGINHYREAQAIHESDLDALASVLQQQCAREGKCPGGSLPLSGACETLGENRFSCLRKGVRFKVRYGLLGKEQQAFLLSSPYWVFTGVTWSGGVDAAVSRVYMD